MAQPALRIYEMDLPRKDLPEQNFHLTIYSPNESAKLRGIVILIHGLGENANRYRLMAKEAMVPSGYTLVVPDLPGHGQTPGPAGVASVESCLAVIEETLQLIARQTKGLPVFLYGHSMGGNLLLNYLLDKEERSGASGEGEYHYRGDLPIRGVVVSSPCLATYKKYPVFLIKILRFLGGLSEKLTVNSRIKLEQLCDDHKVLQDREQDKLCHHRVGMKLFSDLWASGKRAEADAHKLHVPLLLMYGSEDTLVSLEAIEGLAERLPKHMSRVSFEGFLHEVHNMVERDLVYDTVLEFMSLCMQRGGRAREGAPLADRAQAPAAEGESAPAADASAASAPEVEGEGP